MTATKEPSKTIKVTPRVEAEAIALWESGEYKTKAEVARHLRIPVTAAMRVLKGKEKGKSEAKIRAHVEKAIAADNAAEASVRVTRIKDTKEEHYKMAAGLAKLTWQEILAAKTGGATMASIAGNLKAIDIAMSVLKKAREERFAVLGITDDNNGDEDGLPQLVVSELTDEQVEALRNAQDDDDFTDMPAQADDDSGIVDTTGDEQGEGED